MCRQFSNMHVFLSLPNVEREAFQVRQFPCRENKMADATATSPDELVSRAKGWSTALLSKVHQGPGDTLEASMHRAEQAFGVPAQTFWALRYNRLKDISAFVYLRLKAAYEHECQRQEAKLRHELLLTKEILGDAAVGNAAVEQAEALLAADKGEEEAA